MVVPVHQRVPERALRRRRQTDLDPGQGEALGSLPMDRAAFHARANQQAETVACQERERQRKVQNLPDARGCNTQMHSVKKNQTKSSGGSTCVRRVGDTDRRSANRLNLRVAEGDAKLSEPLLRTASRNVWMGDTGLEWLTLGVVATRREPRPTRLVDVIVA